MIELKNHEVEKTEIEVAKLLYDKPWYSDWNGCLLKAKEILNLSQIRIKEK